MTDQITNRDLYDAINSLECKLVERFEKKMERMEHAITENTTFRNQLIGKMTVIFTLLGFAINWTWDVFVNRK